MSQSAERETHFGAILHRSFVKVEDVRQNKGMIGGPEDVDADGVWVFAVIDTDNANEDCGDVGEDHGPLRPEGDERECVGFAFIGDSKGDFFTDEAQKRCSHVDWKGVEAEKDGSVDVGEGIAAIHHGGEKEDETEGDIGHEGEEVDIGIGEEAWNAKEEVEDGRQHENKEGPADEVIGAGQKVLHPLSWSEATWVHEELFGDAAADVDAASRPTCLLLEVGQ